MMCVVCVVGRAVVWVCVVWVAPWVGRAVVVVLSLFYGLVWLWCR
jgi:hypothetical protein